jgi:hypothetical protein
MLPAMVRLLDFPLQWILRHIQFDRFPEWIQAMRRRRFVQDFVVALACIKADLMRLGMGHGQGDVASLEPKLWKRPPIARRGLAF